MVGLIYDTICVSAFVCVKISMNLCHLCQIYVYCIYLFIYLILQSDHCERIMCACPPTRRTLAASLAWPTAAAHANIWPKYFTDFSQIFHRFGATGFTDFSQIFYRFGALDSQIFHRFFTDPGHLETLDSQIFHRFWIPGFTDFSQK